MRTWPVSPVASAANPHRWLSLAVDEGRSPAVAFWADPDSANASLVLARRKDKTWSRETIVGLRGGRCSLALGPDGRCWIAFLDLEHREIRVAHEGAGGWTVAPVATGLTGPLFGSLSIVVAPDGTPYLSWCAGAGLVVSRGNEDGWTHESLGPNRDDGLHCALTIDADGTPHVCYAGLSGRSVKYTHRSAGNWSDAEVLDKPEADVDVFVSEHLSLALDSRGDPGVAYWAGRGLRYKGRSQPHEWVEVGDGVGLYPALRFDGEDRPVIAYQDAGDGALKIATRGPEGWLVETVDEASGPGDSGSYTSLALDDLGVPHVAYVDPGSGDVRYARANTPPMAEDDHLVTYVNQSVQGRLLANDTDAEGDPLSATRTPVHEPSHGTVVIQPNGDVTYTPDEGYHGRDLFRYEVADPDGLTDTAAVYVDVQIPVLVAAITDGVTPHNRASKIDVEVDARDPDRITVTLQRQQGGEWRDTDHAKSLSHFRIQPKRTEFGTGPHRLAFTMSAQGYTLAYSEVFDFPEPKGQILRLHGSLQASEP